MLLYRFATFIWPFVIGFVYVILEKRKTKGAELEELKNEKREQRNETFSPIKSKSKVSKACLQKLQLARLKSSAFFFENFSVVLIHLIQYSIW